MSAAAHQVHWTEEDYLQMEADSPIKHEYLDGEIYAMAGARPRHNAICHNVNGLLHALLRGSPCKGFTSDQRVYVPLPKKFYTYADGGVACGKWKISDKDDMSLLNPVLLVEVLSKSTRKYDRGGKLLLYRQVPSLTDVLIVDQPTVLIDRNQLHHAPGTGPGRSRRFHGPNRSGRTPPRSRRNSSSLRRHSAARDPGRCRKADIHQGRHTGFPGRNAATRPDIRPGRSRARRSSRCPRHGHTRGPGSVTGCIRRPASTGHTRTKPRTPRPTN